MFESKIEKNANPVAGKTPTAPAVTGESTAVAGTLDSDAVRKAKKNEASKKMIERKKAAINTLVDLAKRLGNDEEKAAAAYLSGEGRAKGERVAAKDLTAFFFKNGAKTVTETEIFQNTKLGRNEMRAICKKLSTKGTFINFDAEKGIYSLVDEATYTGPKVSVKKL